MGAAEAQLAEAAAREADKAREKAAAREEKEREREEKEAAKLLAKRQRACKGAGASCDRARACERTIKSGGLGDVWCRNLARTHRAYA